MTTNDTAKSSTQFLIILVILLLNLFCLVGCGTTYTSDKTKFKDNDGTYKIVPSTGPEDCATLCKAALFCRGSVFYQPDVTKPEMECRLNNGIGENTPFPSIPPKFPKVKKIDKALNAFRKKHKLGALRYNAQLAAAAKSFAGFLSTVDILATTYEDGTSFSTSVTKTGYQFSTTAIVMAGGQKNWRQAFKQLKRDTSTGGSLLTKEVSEYGVYMHYNPEAVYQSYWVIILASPRE